MITSYNLHGDHVVCGVKWCWMFANGIITLFLLWFFFRTNFVLGWFGHVSSYFCWIFRRGTGASSGMGLPRLSGRGSIQSGGNGSGDDSTIQDDAVDGEDAPN
jgi:hypothetical protein